MSYVDEDLNLVRYLWHAILNDKFDIYSEVAKQVVDFALDDNKPAILFASSLTLATGSTIDLNAKVSEYSWRSLVAFDGRVVLGGEDNNDLGVLAVVGCNGNIQGYHTFSLTNNGYSKGEVFFIKKVFADRGKAVVLVVDRNGTARVVDVSKLGQISEMWTGNLLPITGLNKKEKVVRSVTAIDNNGAFIIGGINWIKMLTVRLK